MQVLAEHVTIPAENTAAVIKKLQLKPQKKLDPSELHIKSKSSNRCVKI